MKQPLIILFMLFFEVAALAGAKAPLAERVVTMNTAVPFDEAYNQALEEMQNLPPAEKAKLSKALETIFQKDKSVERRANAASALGDLCADVKSNDQILNHGAQDKDKVVRQAVVSAITRCGATTKTIETLKKLESDKDETVKALAEANLEKLGAKTSGAAK